MTTFKTEIESDVPSYMAASGSTATLSELKKYVAQYRCRNLEFGIKFDAGFDSLIEVRRLYKLTIDGVVSVVLTGRRSCYPGYNPGRVLSFRHEKIEGAIIYPTLADIVDLDLPHETPVFCAVKRSFSNRGPHTLIGIHQLGVQVSFSFGAKRNDPGVKRKIIWHVNTDILSLWCDNRSHKV